MSSLLTSHIEDELEAFPPFLLEPVEEVEDDSQIPWMARVRRNARSHGLIVDEPVAPTQFNTLNVALENSLKFAGSAGYTLMSRPLKSVTVCRSRVFADANVLVTLYRALEQEHDEPTIVQEHDRWERPLATLASLSAGWIHETSVAPSAATCAEAERIARLIPASMAMPRIVVDDSIGDVTFRWTRNGSNAFLALTVTGAGIVHFTGQSPNNAVSLSVVVSVLDEQKILSTLKLPAFKTLVANP